MDIVLSVVIVEYHSISEIRNCVSAIAKHLSMPYEVIVSSNSCYDERQIPNDFDKAHVRWLSNPVNGGFAYAMNEGLKIARGRYLAIMNSDCVILSDMDKMIAFMDSHPDVGAIAPQMRDSDDNIQDTARPYVSVPRYIWRQVQRVIGRKGSILSRKMDYSKIQTVDWLIGAFIMVSRKAYDATGGLDEKFFMYAEDLDWCTRIRLQGLEVVYFPEAIINFKGTRRARKNAKFARIFIRSHIRYWRKFGFFFGYPNRRELN